MVVQGPGGQTYAKGRGAVGATDGTRSAAAAGSRTGVRAADGTTAVAGRRVAGATDGVNTVTRGGVAGAVRGPAGNAVAGAAGFRAVNGSVVSAGRVAAVRGNFPGYGWYYTPAWHVRYPGAWVAAGIAATAWWATPVWDSAYGYCGCAEQPVTYDYGNTVTYENNTVYYGDQPVATTEEYFNQATAIAAEGAEAENEEWLPLGVYAVTSGEQTKTDKVLQLAVNKEGVIRGNFHDQVLDQVVQVEGSVDKATQRVALRPSGKPAPVVEAGLWNLTQDSLKVLVHFEKDRAEERTLIRLQQPEEQP